MVSSMSAFSESFSREVNVRCVIDMVVEENVTAASTLEYTNAHTTQPNDIFGKVTPGISNLFNRGSV